MRSFGIAICLSFSLAACQAELESAAARLPPSGNAIAAGVKQIAADAKLKEPLETTEIRPSAVLAPGDWIVCVREASAPKGPAYAVFFDAEYKKARMAIGTDECSTHPYAPYPR